MGESGAKLLLGDHGEAVDAGMNEKTLEAGNTGGGERFNVVLIVADDSAPSQPVDAAFSLRGLALCGERGHCRGWRQTVERHVDQSCVTSGCGGTRGGCETFPLGAAGLVDVDMRVD